MKLPRLRTILLAPLVLFALFYLTGVIMVARLDRSVDVLDGAPADHRIVAIFGASGTAGDGILKAALADPGIDTINVITRRETPRIRQGVEAGKVVMTMHMDYLDYSAVREQLTDVDAVYWAIGISSVGVDAETYSMIHVDFPMAFVEDWLAVSSKERVSFHYISSSDISEDSRAMWAREKVRAENSLFDLAEGTKLKVIAYRPDYIGPTAEEAHLGQKVLYGFFRPVGAAVKATEIGQAMLEVTARGDEFGNGARVGTFRIMRYAEAYESRQSSTSPSQ